MNKTQSVMIFGIHRTSDWWRYIGQNIGFEHTFVVTELRNEGDISITDNFYKALKNRQSPSASPNDFFTEAEIKDIIARCRVLRWLNESLARSMLNAMAAVFDELLDIHKPSIILSFTIDRYVTDVLERRAAQRNIPFLELTASVFSGMSMLLQRGKPVELESVPKREVVYEKIQELIDPTYVASYAAKKNPYNRFKFIKTLGYFRLRAFVFKIISWWNRDVLGLHYLDAQPFLGHKCRWKDIRITKLIDFDWKQKLTEFPREKRVLFGLQLFPEASIDYWIDDLELIQHEAMLVEAAKAFSDAGYLILVKDHPLQFGFRQTDVLLDLLAIKNVILVPYAVSAGELLSHVGVNFNCTGTLGLQATLRGMKSIVTESYYTGVGNFIKFSNREQIKDLPEHVENQELVLKFDAGYQYKVVENLLRTSFNGELFSFAGFDKNQPAQNALELARALGERLKWYMEKFYESGAEQH